MTPTRTPCLEPLPHGACPLRAAAASALALAAVLGGAASSAARGTCAPIESARPAPSPAQSDPQTLWASGERLAAIEELDRRLSVGSADSPEDERTLALWQLTVHRYAAALETCAAHAPGLDDLRGEALYALVRYDEALRYLDPDRPTHALLVVDALVALGELERADEALGRARGVLGQDDARLARFEGQAHARAARHPQAVERFRAALATDPLDQAALFGLGRSLVALGERDEGLTALAEHRRLAPLVDALDFARQSLDLAPNHAPNIASVAGAERDLGRLDLARDLYLRALDLAAPEELTPIALRAARLLEEDLKQPEPALSILRTALERASDVRLAVRAGDVAERLGRPEEARALWERALRARPDDAAIRQRLERLIGGGAR
jgi:tetratricopeptide (TPR) repeat protein